MNSLRSAAWAAVVSLTSLVPAAPAAAGDYPAAEAGARYGQATAASGICPGGTVTAKAKELAASYTGAELAAFTAEYDKVVEGWKKAFECKDIDPETGRMTECRNMKIKSCRAAWMEIGPNGSAIPALLEFVAPEEKPD